MDIMCNPKLDFYFYYLYYNTDRNYKSVCGSTVVIVTRESVGKTRVRTLASTRYIFFFFKISTSVVETFIRRIEWALVLLGVRRLGDEVNHSPPYRNKVMNEWSHNSTLHGVARGKPIRDRL